MKIYYRLSDAGYNKIKFPYATKQRCLFNFLENWIPEEVTVLVDKVVPETRKFLEEYRDIGGLDVQFIQGGSSAQSFKIAVDRALELPDDEIVYLVEDDYIHAPYSRKVMLEGVERADYVTLYCHADKFIPASKGGNPFIDEDGGEITKVFLTSSSFWMLTNSTTCTFATTVKTLKADYDIWKKWCFVDSSQTHPNDFQTFLELREHGRSLIMTIPGYSTHCETQWASPLINWENMLK